MLYIPVRHITLFDGGRVTSVVHPQTGAKKTHGLGAVGDPILPFLDHRAEGYMLTLAKAPDSPMVWETDTNAEPLASGKLPSRRVPWSAVGAPDFDPFAGSDEGAK